MTNPFINLTYAESLALVAEEYAEREALIFRDRRYSFTELKAEADAMSARFFDLGLRSGDKVAILMPNRPEFLFAWLGAAQMGMVAVMINTRLREEEIAYQLAQSESDAVFIPGQGAFRDFVGEIAELTPALRDGKAGELASEKLPDLRWVIVADTPPEGFAGVTDWSAPPPAGLELPPMETDINRPGIIAYSSGTTALPKGAMIGHQVWRKGWDIGTRVDFGENECLYMAIPLFGSMATMNGVLPFWTRGAKVVLGEQFDATACLTAIEAEKVTSMHLLPQIIRQWAEHEERDKFDTSSLRVGVVLSISPDVLDMVADDLKVPGAITGYGMTETTTVVTRNRWDDPREVRHTTQGYVLPDIKLKIVDPETLQELPPNQLGEIWTYGYCNMLGYYNKPKETARAMRNDGWFRTGDVGRLDETGRLTFTGRMGDGYKSRGFNVAPEEIEYILARVEGVSQCAVVGVPDGSDDNIGVAFVIPEKGASLTETDLLDQIRPQLASYKMPQKAFFVEEFPLTTGTSKVQKFKLRKDALARING